MITIWNLTFSPLGIVNLGTTLLIVVVAVCLYAHTHKKK